MRIPAIAAVLSAAASVALAGLPAEAQKFPSHLKSCRKDVPFEKVDAEYVVPVVNGGVGVVRVVSQNYTCTDNTTRNQAGHALRGMKDASGKLIVPFAYAKVLPFSTTGAVVIDHGDGPYPKNLMYRTYIAGKGEGRERFDFQGAMMAQPSNGCPLSPGARSTGSVSAVIGSLSFNVGGGKSHVTLFTPDGRARKLEYMGGDGMPRPAVRRVGDVLLAHWRDQQGVARSGILDLYGRQVAPVLSNAVQWITTSPKLRSNSVSYCDAASSDLFIEGPSLDYDTSKPFFGPLLIPVGRDGQPVTLPRGAIGMFPVYRRQNQSSYSDAAPDMTDMWAVVFPKADGFEFTLHLAPPSEALLAAETAPRYRTMARTHAFDGLVTAQQAADGKWVTFHAHNFIPVGDIDADFDRSLNSAWAILETRAAEHQKWVEAENARRQAERAEEQKRNWQAAKASGRMCSYRVDSANTRADVEEYISACGPDNFPGLADLALAKGVPQVVLDEAANAQAMRMMEVYKARAAWEEERRLRDQRNANKDPMASYMPGQWESAIRNAGNAATEAINQSSDNWLQERRDQYIADWQRSQRAY